MPLMLVRIYGDLAILPEVAFFVKLDPNFPNWTQIWTHFFKKSIFLNFFAGWGARARPGP